MIKNGEVFKNFTENDFFEYKEVCKKIKEHAILYEKKLNKKSPLNDFFIDYIFNTSHSGRFYNIEVKFVIRKRIFKRKIYFTIIGITEISKDDYLDIILEIKNN